MSLLCDKYRIQTCNQKDWKNAPKNCVSLNSGCEEVDRGNLERV